MSPPQRFQPIESPCERICVVDPDTDVCIGCNRTLDEIANWASYTHAERRAIMNELPLRSGDGGEAEKKSA
ncbi:MAG: DUF1289 domain-containing protein [Casimicrobium sp.]